MKNCDPVLNNYNVQVVVRDENMVVVAADCNCDDNRHGWSGTLYKDNFYPMHDTNGE